MFETIFDIFLLRNFQVSTHRKVRLLILSLALGVASYVYVGGYVSSEFTGSWLKLLLLFLSLNLVVSLVSFLLISAYRGRSRLPVGEQDNFTLGTDALGRTIVVFGTIGSVLPIFNIPFHQFLTSFSLVAVATVLIFKNSIDNFLSGFRLMFSRDLLIGDYIKVSDSARGVIRSINFQNTKLKTDDGNILYIPNAKLISEEVINFSKLKLKRITVPFKISTKLLWPSGKFEEVLVKELADNFPDFIEVDKVYFRISTLEMGDSECVLEISVDHYSFKVEKQITKFVYQKVVDYVMNNPIEEKK